MARPVLKSAALGILQGIHWVERGTVAPLARVLAQPAAPGTVGLAGLGRARWQARDYSMNSVDFAMP